MSRHISMEEIKKISKRSHLSLYGETSQTDIVQEKVSPVLPTEAPIKLNKRLENGLKIMKSQLEHKHIFLFRQEAALKAGIKGGATLSHAETELLSNGFIKKHTLSKAKTKICLWEITERGYKQLQTPEKKWQSKGGSLHKFCSYRIAESYTNLGYKATIEHRHINGKFIDLCLKKENEIIFIEICASYPLDKELSNLNKDIVEGSFPDKLIFAVTKRAMRKELQQLLASQDKSPCPVEVVLAGDLIKLEVIK